MTAKKAMQQELIIKNYSILNSNYSSKVRTKINKPLYARSKKPTINAKETSVKSNLFK